MTVNAKCFEEYQLIYITYSLCNFHTYCDAYDISKKPILNTNLSQSCLSKFVAQSLDRFKISVFCTEHNSDIMMHNARFHNDCEAEIREIREILI